MQVGTAETQGVTVARVRSAKEYVVVGVYGGGAKHPALPKGVEYPYPACLRTVRAGGGDGGARGCSACACVCMLLHSGASCKLEAALLTIVSASTGGVRVLLGRVGAARAYIPVSVARVA